MKNSQNMIDYWFSLYKVYHSVYFGILPSENILQNKANNNANILHLELFQDKFVI